MFEIQWWICIGANAPWWVRPEKLLKMHSYFCDDYEWWGDFDGWGKILTVMTMNDEVTLTDDCWRKTLTVMTVNDEVTLTADCWGKILNVMTINDEVSLTDDCWGKILTVATVNDNSQIILKLIEVKFPLSDASKNFKYFIYILKVYIFVFNWNM